MPRIVQTELTRRAPSETQASQPSVGLGVYSRIMGTQKSIANTSAGQIAKALGVVIPGVEQRIQQGHQDNVTKGMMAAESGNMSTKGQDGWYAEGVQRIQALNAGAKAQAAVQDYLSHLDPTTPMPDAMAQVDKIFHDTMGEAAGTADQAKTLLPIATKLRAAAYEHVAAAHQQYLDQLTLNDATDTVHTELATTGTIDTASIQKLHDSMLQAGVSPSNWNKWLVTTVGTLAQEHGNTALFDVLDKSYGKLNGKDLPPPSSVASLQDTISKYKYYASSQEKYNEKAAQADLKQKQKLVTQQTESAVMQAMLTGKDPRSIIQSYVDSGGDGTAAYKMLGWAADGQEKIQSGQYQPAVYSNLVAGVWTGETGMKDVMHAYTSGALGVGDQAAARLKSLMTTMQTEQTHAASNPVFKSQPYKLFAAKVKEIWKPNTTMASVDHSGALRQQTAIELYNQHVSNGETPAEAFAKVQKEVPLDAMNVMAEKGTWRDAGYSFGPGAEAGYKIMLQVRHAVQAVKDKSMAPADFYKNYGSNLNALKSLHESGQLDDEDYKSALRIIRDQGQ